jgi:hypothetical protein
LPIFGEKGEGISLVMQSLICRLSAQPSSSPRGFASKKNEADFKLTVLNSNSQAEN